MARTPTARPDGRKIRQLIWDTGYPLTEFARRTGIPRQTIWNICATSRPTGIRLLKDIARGLGVRTIDISDWEDDGDRDGAAA